MQERPAVLSPQAAAAAAHPLATQAALELMRRGGSAADAAVGAGAVMTVVEPWSSHLGGDAFAIVWDARERRARAVQGSGIAPGAADAGSMRAAGGIPLRGGTPITVPGMIGAWFHLLGTRGRLPVEEVFEPAARLAEEGFPAGGRWAGVARRERALIERDPELSALFLRDGAPVAAGARIRQPDLAATLRELARGGSPHFYQGSLGERVVAAVSERGGKLAMSDLRPHRTEEIDPLAIEIGGATVLEQPPVSQGIMVLAMLRILDACDRRGLRIDEDSPRSTAREVHLQIEAYRHVRAFRDRWLCDPEHARATQSRMLREWIEPAWGEEVAARLDPRKTSRIAAAEDSDVRDTTYLCAVDPDGNAVSWIQSVFHPFGAGFVVPGTGVLLNNRMVGFSLDPESPNCLAPGKRPVHTLNAWMAVRDGSAWLIGGTPGAERQIQTNVQVLRARMAFGRGLVDALRAPRWGIDEQDRVAIEARIPREARRRLEKYGHRVVRVGPWDGSGFVQAIERLPEGGWLACTDPRGEGLAAGY